MQSRTKLCICLGRTRNIQGSHWFLNVCTGRRIKCRTFTPLPAPLHTIAQVHELSDEYSQNAALDFCDRHGNPTKDAPLAAPTVTAHDDEIARVDGIGVNNSGVDQLGNEHQNYEISGVEYDDNGEISSVDENTAVLAVDMPLNKIPGVDPEIFEEEFVQDTNPNATMPHYHHILHLERPQQPHQNLNSTQPRKLIQRKLSLKTPQTMMALKIHPPEKSSILTRMKTRMTKKKKI